MKPRPAIALHASPPSARAADSIETMCAQHLAKVKRWARRLAGPSADLEDLVHEIFLVAGRRLPEFRGNAKVTTWLYRITERVALDGRRRNRFRRWFAHARSVEIERNFSPSQPTPLDELERRYAAESVYRILDRLPDKYRTVLILFELEELSGEEIAALTGLKVSTVWVQLHRARTSFLCEMKRALGREP
jgi:RNA polymerase sigma-70 factor (ECF subfamily)